MLNHFVGLPPLIPNNRTILALVGRNIQYYRILFHYVVRRSKAAFLGGRRNTTQTIGPICWNLVVFSTSLESLKFPTTSGFLYLEWVSFIYYVTSPYRSDQIVAAQIMVEHEDNIHGAIAYGQFREPRDLVRDRQSAPLR